MQQELLNVAQTFTVSQLANRLEKWFEKQPTLQNISITGEISNFSATENGNVYFDLKDDRALLRCFAFASRARAFPAIKNGNAVVATGTVQVWRQRSQYQLVVNALRLTGVGELYVQQEELKAKFEREGLFSPERRRPLPQYPFSIALVSRRGADGEVDFCREIAKAPHISVTTIDSPVQGIGAGPEIADAIDRANRMDVDVIAIVRGGGSFEDLFVFSTEPVVRAIVRSKVPVITGVGHHAHTMLCDLVADQAFGTPTAAAAFFAIQRTDTIERIGRWRAQITRMLERTLSMHAQLRDAQHVKLTSAIRDLRHAREKRLRDVDKRLSDRAPTVELNRRRDRLTRLSVHLHGLREHLLGKQRLRLERAQPALQNASRRCIANASQKRQVLAAHLAGKDPTGILKQGYAIVRHNGKALRDSKGVAPGEEISAQLARGTIRARVEGTENGG